MKQEDKEQHELVMWFSQTYPEYYGCLWAVFNEDSKHKKALGMHRGVSDIHLFINGIFAGIEVKAPNSVHKKKHIQSQIEWGQNVIKNGGFYYIGSSQKEMRQFIIDIIENGCSQIDSLKYIERQIDKKTIKF